MPGKQIAIHHRWYTDESQPRVNRGCRALPGDSYVDQLPDDRWPAKSQYRSIGSNPDEWTIKELSELITELRVRVNGLLDESLTPFDIQPPARHQEREGRARMWTERLAPRWTESVHWYFQAPFCVGPKTNLGAMYRILVRVYG